MNVDQEENGNNVEENTNYNDTIKLGNTSDGFNKWQPSRNFEQSDSDIDDPHFTELRRSSTQEAATDCTDLTSDYSETHTTDSSTATTLPDFPEYRERPRKYSKDPIDNRLMEKTVGKVVDEVPWDIDGTCKYIVQCCSENWLNKTKDGRYFHLRTTGKDPNIAKRVGHCQGSFVCKKEDCYKRTYENTINKIDFIRDEEGKTLCGPCGSYARRIYCGAIKRITFDRNKGHAIVEHQRVHNCNLKPDKRKKQRIIDSHPMPISGFNTPLKTKKAMMRMKMDRKEYGDVKEIAESISAKDLKARISRLRRDASRPLSARDECEVYAHIRRLKKEFEVEFEDPYLVFKECCSHEVVGEDGSFVFKTSKSALEIAAKMSGMKTSKGEPSHLQKEPAFFDGMHSRVRLYKSLTLWVYHSAIRKMLLLAIMEAPRENTYYITKFFELFRDAMREYLGDESYEWRPDSIMMDEKGANFKALEAVMGKDFVDHYTMTCQYHFKQCAEEKMQAKNVPQEERKSFRKLLKILLEASTLPEYYNVCRDIDKAVKHYGLEGWWRWWKPRGFHLVPALRGFNLPRSNYAESGQSKLKGDRKISLIESVIEDCMEFLVQASDYKNFINNTEVVRGRGPSQFEREEKERREERNYVESAVQAIRSGDLLKCRKIVDSEPRFVPGGRARHKAPKDSRTGVQGNVRGKTNAAKKRTSNDGRNSNEDNMGGDKGESAEPTRRSNPDRRGRGHNPRYDSSDEGFDDDAYSARLLPEDYKELPVDVERRQIEDLQKVEYIPLGRATKTSNVSICQGCINGFKDEKYFKSPMNLVFRYKMYRKRPNKNKEWVLSNTKTYGYFHAEDMFCIRNYHELRNLSIDDVYMSNATFGNLTNGHFTELEKRQHLEPVLNTRRELRKVR